METETPVLIVGGGGAGLAASMLLSKLGIEHILARDFPDAHRKRNDALADTCYFTR